MVVRQQDIQRRGGVCVKYPVSCLVRKLVFSVLDHGPLYVLDLTFGEGRFWRGFDRGKLYIVGFDVRRLDWHVEPDEFYMYPSWRWRHLLGDRDLPFDLVVADPPWAEWRRGWDRRGHYLICNMLGWWRQIVFDAAAADYYNAYLLLHWKKPYIPPGYQIIKEVFFKGRSRLANLRNTSWFAILKRGGFDG